MVSAQVRDQLFELRKTACEEMILRFDPQELFWARQRFIKTVRFLRRTDGIRAAVEQERRNIFITP